MSTTSLNRHATAQRESSIAGKAKLSWIWIALLVSVGLICSSRQAAAQAGKLDPTFGKGGVFSESFPLPSLVTSVALQSDGKILAAGQINNVPGVIRLNTNGTLDTSFGKGGAATNTFNGFPWAMWPSG